MDQGLSLLHAPPEIARVPGSYDGVRTARTLATVVATDLREAPPNEWWCIKATSLYKGESQEKTIIQPPSNLSSTNLKTNLAKMIPTIRRRFTIPRSSWMGRRASEQSLRNPPAEFKDNDPETAAILAEHIASLLQDEGSLTFLPTKFKAKLLEEGSISDIDTVCGSHFSGIGSDDENIERAFFADDSTLLNEGGVVDVVAIGRPAQTHIAPSPLSKDRLGTACGAQCHELVDRIPTPAIQEGPFYIVHQCKQTQTVVPPSF
ncbi:hypothetical protein FA13DRAFT_1717704 [Coprinellus micaceus]|uniref:Uncharacterized protein n=1 Tax=Coprinellus micaceus TaxID=71717 RepID=A0A4Y7SFN0_COPMI|nr:hypothetical protein FA13DRAFT_1717704 [Coprinellus micaceus]